MTVASKRFAPVREAWDVLRWWHVLLQILLAAVVFGLTAFWLQMPDSNVVWLFFTAVLAVVVVLVATGGETALLLSLARENATRKKLLRGAGIMLLLALLWWVWTWVLAHHGDDSLRASYINSKMPRGIGLRYWFSYEHLLLLQRWFWTALGWIGTGLLAAVLLPWVVLSKPWPASSTALRSKGFWCLLLVVTIFPSMITGALLQWTPGQGLIVESTSLALRLAVCAFIDATAVCLVLSAIAACVQRVAIVTQDAP